MKTLSRHVRPSGDRGARLPRRFAALVGYRATADFVSKAVTLAVTVAAARTLAAEEFGVFALAMTSGWLLGVASDAGLPLHLARRLAAAGTAGRHSGDDIAAVMRARWRLAALAAVAGLAAGLILAPIGMVAAFVLIVAAQLLGAVIDTLSHAYRGLGRSEIESSLLLAYRGATGALALGVLAVAPSLLLLGAALILPAVAALAVSTWLTERLTGTASSPTLRETAARAPTLRLAREAAPIGAAVFLSAIYFRCDVYFVEHWHGLETAGLYNAAFRIVEALRLVPAAALVVAFPAFCTATGLRVLGRLSVPLAAAGLLLFPMLAFSAAALLEAVYGARFVEAAPALRVLASAVPLFFVNYALTHQVIAWDGAVAYLGITAAALVANVAGNIWLIPGGGMVGAAQSTVITELVVSTGCVVALTAQYGGIRQRGPLPMAGRAAVPGDAR